MTTDTTRTQRRMSRTAGREARQRKRRRDRLMMIAGGIVVVLAAFGIALLAGGSDAPPSDAIETAPVVIDGDPLPPAPQDPAQADQVVGLTAPTASGVDFDGRSVDLLADDLPNLVMFLAHWCPHCQVEVPRVVAHWGDDPPAGVRILGVATSTSTAQPNYPPSAWLDREGWPFEVMVDSADGELAAAYGVTAFPMFVLVDADGTVLMRTSGELTTDQLDDIAELARA